MHYRRVRWSVLLVMSSTLLALTSTRDSSAQASERCFPATSFCIRGRIRTYWERNGGLPIFGFPIGPQQAEAIEGRMFQAQWFERVRLELHPENRQPYDVLLGLLGNERHGRRPMPPPGTGAAPLPPPDEAATRLHVPAGFQVRAFAAGLAGPRLMTIGPDGVLYVAERSANRIVRLPDRNGDGLADASEVVVDDLTQPHNMEWIAGCLYVAENDKVSRHCDADGDGTLEQRTRTADLPAGDGHSTPTLHYGPDGNLYIPAGSTCHVCVVRDPR